MKTTKPLELKVYRHAAEIPDTWDEIAGAEKRLHRRAIALCEESSLPDMQYYYVIIMQQGNPQAIAYFQLLKFGPSHINVPEQPTMAHRFLKGYFSCIKPSILVAGHLFRHDHPSFAFSDALLTPADAFKVYEWCINKVLGISNASGVFVKDCPSIFVPYFQNHACGYRSLPNDIIMEMRIPDNWESFADYEEALKHKYLQRSKKVRKSLKQLSVRELDGAALEEQLPAMHRLYRKVADNQLVAFGYLNENYFSRLKSTLNGDYKVYGFFLNEELVAYSSVLLGEGIYDMYYLGMDYEHNKNLQLYFNMLFHGLEKAIASGLPKIVMGRTALEAKAVLGCTPDYLYNFYKVSNPVIAWIVQYTQRLFMQQTKSTWQDRHPFKSYLYPSLNASE
jgi:hypothetical protein